MSDPVVRLNVALEGRYAIERELGEGGMATVYLADDIKHNRKVAIKVLKPELAAVVGAERFLREIEIAAKLNHPHILTLIDSGTAAGLVYYVMPLVEGETLRGKIEADERIGIDEAIRITQEVASALDYAHRQGVIHRDVKPENVLLHQGEAMLTDFGIALAVREAGGARLTETRVSPGTPHYMSPEQMSDERDLDGRSDVYSLGCVLYELLTGRRPTEGAAPAQVLAAKALGRFTPVRDLRSDLPDRLTRAVDKALASAPEERFATAGDFGEELGRVVPELVDLPRRRLRRRATAVAAGVGLIGVIVAANLYADRERERWARTTGLMKLERLAAAHQLDSMYALGITLRSLIPDDSAFVRQAQRFTMRTAIRTAPPGAAVFRRPYEEADTTSVYLGTTPLDSVRLPFFASRLRLERPGYQTQELVAFAFAFFRPAVGGSLLRERTITLDPAESAPEGMVRVMGFSLPQGWLSLPEPMAVGDYWLDRYEVTNREYQDFVDAGGYQRPDFWAEPLVRDGLSVPWEEAMPVFVDRTGRPGPSTWSAESYPEGQDEHPVGGVSWYEAAAYARFAGKQLPTYWHWRQGHPVGLHYLVMPRSNIASTRGPAPVGSYEGLGAFGTYDQAGNVREWVYNEREGQRLIMGGAWNDPAWLTLNLITAPPWDRSEMNGFRLARYADDTPALDKAQEPLPPIVRRDYTTEEPASPSDVEIFKRFYTYDPLPLEPRLEHVDSAPDWIRERVSFTAAYGAERMAAYVYLPRRGEPPYQAVIHWPGSQVLDLRRIEDSSEAFRDFIVKTGRALVLPLYYGTFDRDDEQFSVSSAGLPPFTSSRWRDLTIQWVKDLRRTIDVLEVRTDIDTTRIAYFGHSWGAWEAPLVLAVEPRLKVGISLTGGLWNVRFQPEIDPFNFLGAVRTPFLLLGGEWDPIFPLETSQKPMIDGLGTPERDKRWFVHAGGTHGFLPIDIVARESLTWLDRYLGPVRFVP